MSGERAPAWVGPVAWVAAGLLRLLARSWRVTWVGRPEYEAVQARGAGCIHALWHARLLALTLLHRDRDVAALVSRSRDGELITRVIARLGYVAARGSSTRGGREGAQEMLEWARRGRALAVTPDGPRGPVGVVKPGLVWLAARSGAPVVPVGAAADRAWRARSWDRFEVPAPFARVVVSYGAALRVPPTVAEEAGEEWRARLEAAIQAATADADARVTERA